MDWTKAKIILIVALLITNIVLAWNIMNDYMKTGTISNDVIRETLEILNKNHIFVKGEITPEYGKMPVLSVKLINLNKNDLANMLNRQKPLPPDRRKEADMTEMTIKFLKENNLFARTMKQENLEKKDNQFIITYKNYYKNVPIENSYMKCIVQNGRIIDIDRFWLEPDKKAKGKKAKAIIPATAALIKFMSDGKTNEDIYISEIKLVYWINAISEKTSSDTALPAWKITYNGGKSVFILAYDE